MNTLLFFSATIGLLGGGILAGTQGVVPVFSPVPPHAASHAQSVSIDSTLKDSSVSPCADFYQYAVGGWLKRTTITPYDTAADQLWGITTTPDRVGVFSEIAHRTRGTLLHVIEQAQAEAAKTTDPIVRVVGTFYGSCINSSATDAAGQPLSTVAHQWQCFSTTDSMLAPALGTLYMRTMLPPVRRGQAEAFGKILGAAVKHRIMQAKWLGDSSRVYALHKLAHYSIQVGAPPLAEDYRALALSPTDYDHNRQVLKDFLYREQLNVIGHSTEGWEFKPWVINSTEHEATGIVELSAVMWQPPLYDFDGDPAANYGALGVLISHEFMHAFGNVYHAWLNPDDQPAFSARLQKLIDQGNAYTVTDKDGHVQHLDGEKTVEENLADLDGIRVAYDAFERSGAKATAASLGAHSPTPEQRFFLSFANLFREKRVNETLDRNDFHAPESFRVNGILGNLPEFAQAFGCKAGDPMVRSAAQRVEIW